MSNLQKCHHHQDRGQTWFIFLLLLFPVNQVFAAVEWSGHLKYQPIFQFYQADDVQARNGQAIQDQLFDLRLQAKIKRPGWNTQIAYEWLADYGDQPQLYRQLTRLGLPLNLFPDDKHRLLDLTTSLYERGKLNAVQRLDRLSVSYHGEQWILKLGRQAVSWGNGLVFQPLDIFAPFAPTAVDKAYKTGEDMLYGQWLLDNGADIQWIILPRRHIHNHKLSSGQSSFAVKFHHSLEEIDFDLLLARHYAQNSIGAGFAADIGGAVWRMDIRLDHKPSGGNTVSMLSNLDYAWTLYGKNVYGLIEYYYNGFGLSQSENYAKPPAELSQRLLRGDLFNLGRDYLATALQIELSPLYNLFASSIFNLHDQSGIMQLRLQYEWQDNRRLWLGADLPWGKRGSEFGGIVLNEKYWLGSSKRLYLNLGFFF
ncbi:hypothetical protein QUF61_15615 [Candidatus Venteria ishoeyi]|uniref:hypothetical protein n=1 Tax=Candidatus Venteria ishoeyi TaxID=1899563 RepID=UPI0025A66FD8|nr:hypothetical protein [Candidatus Venteria ishoeyi]MDM8547916.1 hypothetical protein [Candidatus Venteria ishoeyi]